VISAISTLVEEQHSRRQARGLAFRGMDPSHVALIDISWPNSAFEKYVCDEDVKFGVRIDEFAKLIKRADKKDAIEISISEEKLLLVTIGKNKKYKMRLIESSATDTPLPKITYNAKVAVTSAEFDRILGDIQVVSEYLSISANQAKAEFSGRGDSGEAVITLEKGMPEMPEIEVKEDSTATYSLEYLNSISQGGRGGGRDCGVRVFDQDAAEARVQGGKRGQDTFLPGAKGRELITCCRTTDSKDVPLRQILGRGPL